jgi:RHS repeat-associated protein
VREAALANAYVTSVTMPTTNSVAHVTSATYDSNTGLKTQETDQNSQPTSYAYDSINRPASITYPDGGKKTFIYTGATIVEVQTLQSGSAIIDQYTYLDGLGRTKQTRTVDPEGDDLVDYAYNALGQPLSVSNPHRSTGSTTDGTTQYSYDGLGRTTLVTLPDSNNVQTSFSGPCVTTTDQAGSSTLRCSDALGRLAQVTEPNPSTGSLTTGSYPTSYAYDLLDNLTQVTQNGDNSANKRVRTLTYDSLARVKSVQMPESGMTTFDTYDANGNLTQQTDARGVKTTLSYDGLNRLTGKTFSDGTKPISIYYDQSSSWSSTLTNPIGRITTVNRGSPFVSGTVYSYDAKGRVVTQLDCRPSNCGTSAFKTYYAYDHAGNLTSVTYPSGRVVTYSFTPSNALSAINFASYGGSSVNYTYASIPNHFPTGDPSSINYGNGLTDTVAINNRLQRSLYQLAAGSQNLMKRSYSYSNGSSQNNGNLWSITDQLRSGGNQTFAYDYLNRLTSASQADNAYTESFSYDAWGNLKQSGTWAFQNINYDTNNRIVAGGFAYDANGNLTGEGTTNHSFTYDGENHMATVDTTSATYTYGADGLRDRKDAGSTYSEYIYMGTTPIAENNESGDWTDYVVGPMGKTIKAEGLDRGLRIYGTNCSSCGTQSSLFYFNGAGGLTNYTIQNGDKLYLLQYQQSGSKGGVVIAFSDGTNTNWNAKDTTGYYANDDQSQATSHFRIIDLSSFAGKTISNIAANVETDTAAGAWAIIYEEMALVGADGTVHPLYTGQTSSPLGAGTGSSGVTGRGSTVDTNRNKAIYPTTTTTYYHTDGVGTALIISQGGGWPVWQGLFAPFGQEVDTLPSIDQNKFATYQHENESNLEHAGFRKYASIQGRFTSPDPYLGSIALENPQSWNRYAYAGNTPMIAADPLGLFVHDPMWSGSYFSGGMVGDGSYGGDLAASGRSQGMSENGIPQWYLDEVNQGQANLAHKNDPAPEPSSGTTIWVFCDGTVSGGKLTSVGCAVPAEAIDGSAPFMRGDAPAGLQIFNDNIRCGKCGEIWRDANQVTNPRTIAAWYGASAIAGAGGYVISDLAAGPQNSVLFGRGFFGWTGYLNGNAPWGGLLRIGYGWNGTQSVFRIGGSVLGYFMNNPHIDLWPPSAW